MCNNEIISLSAENTQNKNRTSRPNLTLIVFCYRMFVNVNFLRTLRLLGLFSSVNDAILVAFNQIVD